MGEQLNFVRLTTVDPIALIGLLNDPRVCRHMPLAGERFDATTVASWIDAKEDIWRQHGFGPKAILLDDRLIGWGGLEVEDGDWDISLVLHPDHWGRGREIFWHFAREAFALGAPSVIVCLPFSRTRFAALYRAGFEADGEIEIAGVPFRRFRFFASHETGIPSA